MRTASFPALFAVLICCAATSAAADPVVVELKAQYARPAEIPFPDSNPYTVEKAALGKALFFDPRVSAAQNMNCASCHNPSFGWQVPLKRAIGAKNAVLARNAPTILNHAWGGRYYFWDGRAASLEEQAKGPIEAENEMNMPLDQLVERLKNIPDYQKWFDTIFPGEGIGGDTIAKALATFERTVVSGFAPFDDWIQGDEAAISDSAKRGFALFNGKANCAACHSGWNFTDNAFHDTGLPDDDIGRGKFDLNAMNAFKTPSLREIARRAPYMHDGSLATLRDVIAHYTADGAKRPTVSPRLRAGPLAAQDVDDLLAFLGSLSGNSRVIALPVLPN